MVELHICHRLNFADTPGNLDVTLTLPLGSLTVLTGPSGAGKTSLLRIIAGLLTPDSGRIVVDQTVWLDTAQHINLAPQQRHPGFVFQDYALFPNMTVRENLRFAATTTDASLIDPLLERLALTPLANRKPQNLSGGQRQRAALARAIVRRPAVLLLDEPFSALDTETALTLRDELLLLHREFGTTTLIVSHQSDLLKPIADRVLYLEQGKLGEQAQQKTPIQLAGQVVAVTADSILIDTVSGSLRLPAQAGQWQAGDAVTLAVQQQ